MTEEEVFIGKMKSMTKKFALDISAFCADLPKNQICYRIGVQLLRSETSAGANYRASCRLRSQAEFFSKISIVIEEGDKCGFWLESLIDSTQHDNQEAHQRRAEASEITSILATVGKTLCKSEFNHSIIIL